MASGGPPGGPGGPRLRFHGLFRQFRVNVLWTRCVRSVSLVLGCYVIYGTVTSCVMSRHGTGSGQSGLFLLLLALSSYLRFALVSHIWLVSNVCRSSTSPGWSLLPSSVIIVLALVNSAMSHRDLGIST